MWPSCLELPSIVYQLGRLADVDRWIAGAKPWGRQELAHHRGNRQLLAEARHDFEQHVWQSRAVRVFHNELYDSLHMRCGGRDVQDQHPALTAEMFFVSALPYHLL